MRTTSSRSLIVALALGCGRIGYTTPDEGPMLGDGAMDGATDFDAQVGMDDGAQLLDTAPSPLDAQDAEAGYDAGADGCFGCVPNNVILTGQDQTTQRGDPTAGTPYLDLCPENQVLLGLQGSVSRNPSISWMHSIQALCGTISVVGTASYQIVTTATVWLPERGQNGGVAWSSLCPANQVVIGTDGRSSGYLDQLALRCAPLTVTGAYGIAIGAVTVLPPVGSASGTPFPTTDCPAGEVARGADVRADNYPRAFGLICGTPSLAAP